MKRQKSAERKNIAPSNGREKRNTDRSKKTFLAANVPKNAESGMRPPQKRDLNVLSLPLGHLQFTPTTQAVFKKFPTVGSFLRMMKSSEDVVQWPPNAAKEAARVLKLLERATLPNGVIHWDKFRRSRPTQERRTIYLASPSLERLSWAAANLRLSSLHFAKRTINVLEAVGVRTIGELIKAATAGISGLWSAGDLTRRELLESLDALASSVGDDGRIDWIKFARARGFAVLPKRATVCSGSEFLAQLRAVAAQATEIRYGKLGSTIFARRLTAVGAGRLTLKQIGTQFGYTREFVRKYESAIIKMLRRAILESTYRRCTFRIRSEFLKPLRHLSDEMQRLPSIISYETWISVLRRTVKLVPSEFGAEDKLLLTILGFEPIEFNQKTEPIIVTVAKGNGHIRNAAHSVERLLQRYPLGLHFDELHCKLIKELGESAPSREELSVLISNSLLEQERETSRYRFKIENLRRPTSRYIRLLAEAGRPLHYSELFRKDAKAMLQHGQSFGLRSVCTRLGSDPRLKVISKSGLWILHEWSQFDTRGVGEIAEELLRATKRPLHETALVAQISKRRPMSQKYIGRLLSYHPALRRVAPRTWTVIRKRATDGT